MPLGKIGKKYVVICDIEVALCPEGIDLANVAHATVLLRHGILPATDITSHLYIYLELISNTRCKFAVVNYRVGIGTTPTYFQTSA